MFLCFFMLLEHSNAFEYKSLILCLLILPVLAHFFTFFLM